MNPTIRCSHAPRILTVTSRAEPLHPRQHTHPLPTPSEKKSSTVLFSELRVWCHPDSPPPGPGNHRHRSPLQVSTASLSQVCACARGPGGLSQKPPGLGCVSCCTFGLSGLWLPFPRGNSADGSSFQFFVTRSGRDWHPSEEVVVGRFGKDSSDAASGLLRTVDGGESGVAEALQP